MNNYPSLSIIIPSYNQGEYIERTILSILKQDYPGDVQVIVSDGGSTDNTVEILKRYPQIIWWSEKDEGFVDAVMKGFKVATGDIFAIQSSDDFYLKDAFKITVNEFLQSPDFDIIVGCDLYMQSNRVNYFCSNLDSHEITPYSLLVERNIPQHCAFFRKKVLEKLGGLRKEVDTCADTDFWYRALHFFKGKFIPYHTAVYQFHANQRTQVLDSWEVSLIKMIESCESDPVYKLCFFLSDQEKKNLYLRWHFQRNLSLQQYKGNLNSNYWMNKISEVMVDSDISEKTKNYIQELAISYQILPNPKQKSRLLRIGESFIDGSFFKKVFNRLLRRNDIYANVKYVDVNWWSL
jgi:glycosyltransferase involved in cell wall biosynthesis